MFLPETIDDTILARLADYYPAFGEVEQLDLWLAFIKAWNQINALLCWSGDECSDLIQSERVVFKELNIDWKGQQIIKLPHKKIISIDSVEIQLFTAGGNQVIEIENPQSFYIEAINSWQLFLNRKDLNSCQRCIGEAFIKITYTAGYEDIPECFFSAISQIIAQAWCDKNCLELGCKSTDRLGVNAALKEKWVGDRKWVWDLGDREMEKAINNLQTQGLLSQIGQFSNCINKISFTVGAFC